MGAAEVSARLNGMGNGLYYIIVVDCQIVGTWKRTLKQRSVFVETSVFSSLTKAESGAVAATVQKYGEFLKLPVVLA